ncbi:hypothetical protein BXZ70DRAFT_1039008 [Cristinia sonorae]|uniref:Uncharacterized protein n=1 Tax=Cristinia sonorae TaxID=1940300 RepID=A0A8K0XM46_9AGAR|nr:hypothetical protein BXZ70DRAFT_1039008 [Cristinia sonorae]
MPRIPNSSFTTNSTLTRFCRSQSPRRPSSLGTSSGTTPHLCLPLILRRIVAVENTTEISPNSHESHPSLSGVAKKTTLWVFQIVSTRKQPHHNSISTEGREMLHGIRRQARAEGLCCAFNVKYVLVVPLRGQRRGVSWQIPGGFEGKAFVQYLDLDKFCSWGKACIKI